MTIEITSPDLEALIRHRMQAGAFKTPEDLLWDALQPAASDFRTGADLVVALQSCPYPDVDLEPERVLSPTVRDVAL